MSIALERLYFFVIGPIVSYLVATGKISDACRVDVTNAYSVEIGAAIFIASIALGTIHSFYHAKQTPSTMLPITEPVATQTINENSTNPQP